MFNKLFQTAPLAIASSMAATTLSAAPDNETRLSRLEAQVKEIKVKNVHGTLGGNNPAHNLDIPAFYVTGDFLYWKTNEDGLEFAFTSDSAPLSTATSDGKLHDVKFEWSPGFRVGAGYTFKYDAWDLYANWTHLDTTARKSLTNNSPAENTLTQTWFTPQIGASSFLNATGASARWRMHYNTGDLELARFFFVSRTLALRPFMGVRGAWIEQRYRARYTGGDFGTISPTTFRAHNNFSGGGLRAGLNMLFHFSRNWGLFGKASGSLVYGRFEIREKVTGIVPGGTASATIFEEKHSMNRVRANAEAGGGLQWEYFFCNNKMHVVLSAGYEIVEWFNQNELREFRRDSTVANNFGFSIARDGDLGMQGFTLAARLEF